MEVTGMQEKLLLSIAETSELFGIGQHRLREIIREDYECRYHLTIGRVIKIKRKSFEGFINDVQQI
jgi:phage antirepressor YoqD-like protein